MAGFGGGLVVGLLVGAALGAGGLYVATMRGASPVVADAGHAAPAAIDNGKPGRRKKSGHVASSAGAAGDPNDPAADDAPAIVLSPADLALVTEGDALHVGAASVDMAAGGETRDLSQGDINGAIAERSAAIITCLTTARGAAPVSGRVTAGMLIAADGSVSKTRITAPAYLVHHGLGACLRAQLAQVHFPPTGRETVVTVPFDVHD